MGNNRKSWKSSYCVVGNDIFFNSLAHTLNENKIRVQWSHSGKDPRTIFSWWQWNIGFFHADDVFCSTSLSASDKTVNDSWKKWKGAYVWVPFFLSSHFLLAHSFQIKWLFVSAILIKFSLFIAECIRAGTVRFPTSSDPQASCRTITRDSRGSASRGFKSSQSQWNSTAATLHRRPAASRWAHCSNTSRLSDKWEFSIRWRRQAIRVWCSHRSSAVRSFPKKKHHRRRKISAKQTPTAAKTRPSHLQWTWPHRNLRSGNAQSPKRRKKTTSMALKRARKASSHTTKRATSSRMMDRTLATRRTKSESRAATTNRDSTNASSASCRFSRSESSGTTLALTSSPKRCCSVQSAPSWPSTNTTSSIIWEITPEWNRSGARTATTAALTSRCSTHI